MDRYSKFEARDKSLETVCVKGVFVFEKRSDTVRRHIKRQRLKYDRRFSSSAQFDNRRRPLIDIIV
jgi:hypothetical protein